jgi:hypothetical protein
MPDSTDNLIQKFLSSLTSTEDKNTVENAMQTIEQEQNKYESIVLSHYENDINKLFKPNRTAQTDEQIDKELEQDLTDFMTLIIHCLKSGKAEILYTHGITPIFRTEGGIKRLFWHDNLGFYADVFEDWIASEKVKTALGKMCVQALEQECRKLSQ